ncbi:MAG: glycoside hydrolase family 3 N-terminal domain-containing protein [Phaeodactylibacter sp.]|uniref:glycoside hydrolase family 3 N-terminal domain-containing protein n=1 Tax=Phaeodactylibacter sp. TaxID=1940289 RepID=UPI0032EC1087
MTRQLTLFCLLLLAGQFHAQTNPASAWADSVYNNMTETERLGQLFMIRAHSDLGPEHIQSVEAQIKKYKVGGLCFFQGTPERQVELINQYQKIASPVPLMIAIDGEWGLGMRMKSSTISFPRQLTLGAIQDNSLIYQMGTEIARQMKLAGINVNFAPVADVNNNAANPVINNRSFGEDRMNVAAKSWRYAQGMEDHGVMACAKHFPGHGDTDVDSHYDLPVIRHDFSRLDSIELFPFRQLAKQGIGSMMVAHLNVPALDERKNRPTTLSYNTITNLLIEGLEYDGLIFTDALEMKGVTKHFESGEVEAEALVAGNDILLLPEDMGAAFREIRNYIESGKLSWETLEPRVKKVLRAKYKLGLRKFEPLRTDSLRERLNTDDALLLKRKLLANAMTLVRNPNDLIPFRQLEGIKMASLSINASKATPFQDRLQEYKRMPALQCGQSPSEREQDRIIAELSKADVAIVGLHGMSSSASKSFGISVAARKMLQQLQQKTKVVLVVFGNPYSLKFFDEQEWVLEAYEDSPMMQDLAAEALFGAQAIKGRLPITASPKSQFGDGVITGRLARFGFAPPEAVGMDAATLAKIDGIANDAIEAGATPGCVILVAKDQQIIYKKAFGHHTYSEAQPVHPDDLYDLASVTKVAASTLAVMWLQEHGQIHLDTPIVRYLPELEGTNKAPLCLRDIMAHRAGLKDWIPFYKQTLVHTRKRLLHSKDYYRKSPAPGYEVEVAPDLYLRDDFSTALFQQIYDSEVQENPGYKYSDLGFYLIARIVDRLTGMPMNEFTRRLFYKPMGLQTATYRPLEYFVPMDIAPTEIDNYFRKQALRGYVHDMGAAMLGGVSGHAGLFSNAQDLGAIMQMLLNGGLYSDQQLLEPATIQAFTQRHPESTRRGIGFDMRQLDPSKWINLPADASDAAFGHTGFTGTCAWADPEENLVFVFLSNRSFPDMNNYRLNKMRVRHRILSTVYEAIEQYQYVTDASPRPASGIVLR